MVERKFKKSLFGFKKADVMKYIDELQKSSSDPAEVDSEELKKLREENEKLAQALEKSNKQIELLSDPVKGSNKMLATSLEHSRTHFENVATLVNGICDKANENVGLAGDELAEILKMADKTSDDFEGALKKFREELETLRSHLEKTGSYFKSEEIVAAESEDESDEDNADKIFAEGEKLLQEVQNLHDENAELLRLIK